jgi:hypothetical protein
VKQYIKNKRNNAYKKEYITVPTKYAYLKANAAKRDPSAPRGKKSRVKKVDAAKSAGKKRNKAVAAKPARSSKSHGKRKAVEPTSSDEDEVVTRRCWRLVVVDPRAATTTSTLTEGRHCLRSDWCVC